MYVRTYICMHVCMYVCTLFCSSQIIELLTLIRVWRRDLYFYLSCGSELPTFNKKPLTQISVYWTFRLHEW